MSEDRRTPPRIPELLAVLDRHGVRSVLFGSAGAVAYGADLTPGDLDLCPAPDSDNLRRLAAALVELEARPRVIPGWMTSVASAAWRPDPAAIERFDHLFETRLGDLDLVPRPFGPRGEVDRFTFNDLDARAATISAFGLTVRVAHLDDLIASKLSRQRDKDLRAIPQLERLRRFPRGDG